MQHHHSILNKCLAKDQQRLQGNLQGVQASKVQNINTNIKP